MNLLLDTHVFLWWLEHHPRLPQSAIQAIGHSENEVHVSAASLWEIATKHRLGKLPLPCASPEALPALVLAEQMTLLPMLPTHAVLAGSWSQTHRDPFDRMLAAQAKLEKLALVSADPVFHQFGIPLLPL
jgi:PIN domain nuclease of toxin-antitoxin system